MGVILRFFPHTFFFVVVQCYSGGSENGQFTETVLNFGAPTSASGKNLFILISKVDGGHCAFFLSSFSQAYV